MAGTNFCLDAGSSMSSLRRFGSCTHLFQAPGNGVGMKIWQCYDNLPAQQWYYTADNRIALEGQGSFPPSHIQFSNQICGVRYRIVLGLD